MPVGNSDEIGEGVSEAQIKPLSICSQLTGEGYRQPGREELTITSALPAWSGLPALSHAGHSVIDESRNRLL